MSRKPPHLYTIPPDQSFLHALAAQLCDATARQALFGAQKLEDATILLPTKRARRQLQTVLLEMTDTYAGGQAILLPTIQALTDVEEQDFFWRFIADENMAAQAELSLPPALSPFRRHLVLMSFVKQWMQAIKRPFTQRQLSELTADLEGFLDQSRNQNVDWRKLPDLVKEKELADNWQKITDFLEIVTRIWPDYLRDEGRMDVVERRQYLLDKQIELWQKAPPKGPIIAAGSTGSQRHTAKLLHAIAALPNGAVVLPGLDQSSPDHVWTAIETDYSHPQYHLAQFLKSCEINRKQVTLWPGCQPPSDRTKIIHQALWPAQKTDHWIEVRTAPDHQKQVKSALTHMRYVEASEAQIEANLIALYMRQIYQDEGKTAALVTPDRKLARRVTALLARWNIHIDDSAGQPLAHTQAAIFIRLLLRAVEEKLAPVALLGLLKHPSCNLWLPDEVADFEKNILRGFRPAPHISGLQKLIQTHADEKKRTHYLAMIKGLEQALAPLSALKDKPIYLLDMVTALQESLENIAAEDFFNDPAGQQIIDFFDQLVESDTYKLSLSLADWISFFESWWSRLTFRNTLKAGQRLFIWGPLEARLMSVDLMIMGGLNETIWPLQNDTDPWLSRQMRAALGMALPEQRIGLSAHDFVQTANAAEVIFTRAQKHDGAPMVASRWLKRLQALCDDLPKDDDMLALAANLHRIDGVPTPAPRPAPVSPISLRPNRLSVTQIETLIKDPYAIYARHVLKLKPLDPLDMPISAAQRGTVIHKILEHFNKNWPKDLPADSIAELTHLAEQLRNDMRGGTESMAYWRARFPEITKWLAQFETEQRQDTQHVFSEMKGTLTINGFTLSAVADRIDQKKDGTYAIIDYKTGGLPTQKAVREFTAPQLPLEAAILEQGGFENMPAKRVRDLIYIRLNGGTPAGELLRIKEENIQSLADNAVAFLEKLITQYQNPEQAYISRLRPKLISFASDYDHLARVQEWEGDEQHGEN